MSSGCTETSGVWPCTQSLVCREPTGLPPLLAPRNLCSKCGDGGPEVPPGGRDVDSLARTLITSLAQGESAGKGRALQTRGLHRSAVPFPNDLIRPPAGLNHPKGRGGFEANGGTVSVLSGPSPLPSTLQALCKDSSWLFVNRLRDARRHRSSLCHLGISQHPLSGVSSEPQTLRGGQQGVLSGLLFGSTKTSWAPLWVRRETLPVWWGNVRPMSRLVQYGGRLVPVL